MIDRYIAATGQGDAFERAYWALAAQRNTRILGVFTRLWKRDNKPHYRRFQPRMWGLLERDLAAPHLKPVRDWFDANVAPEHRARAVEAGGVSQARRALRLRAEVPAEVPRTAMIMAAGPRQAHAAADRDPAQAADRGRRQVAARPCARPACARPGSRRSWSTSIISPTRSRRISRPGRTASRSPSPTSATLLLETGGGLVQARAADRLRPVPGDQQRQSVDRRARRHAEAARVALGRRARWTRCCCWSRRRAPRTTRARAISTWTAPGGSAAASAAMSRRSCSPASRCCRSGCFRDAPDGPFSTNILWDRAIEEGRCFGAVHQGLWFDVGTPESIRATEAALAECLTAVAGHPAVFTIPVHRSFADCARRRPDRGGSARTRSSSPGGASCCPTTARSAPSPRRSSAPAAAGLLLPRLVPIGDPELDERIGGALDPIDDGEPIPPAVEPLERLLALAELVRGEAAARPRALRLAARPRADARCAC